MAGRMMLDDETQMLAGISRRAFVVGGAAGFVYLTLAGRLAWLQVVDGQRYATLAEDNRINARILMPLRGQIIDRFGVPIADNTRNYRAVITPEQAKPIEMVLKNLQQKLGLRDSEIDSLLKESKKSKSFTPIIVRDFLNWDQVATIEVSLPDLPGVSIDEGYARLYPFGEATAHVVGYVAAPSKDEAGKDPLLKMPGYRIGKTGMEKALDDDLRGRAGDQQVEVNVVGREVRELGHRDAIPGQRLTLSLDAELQQQLHARLSKERSASAVVMDVKTGEVYALGSYPAFDPNIFARSIPKALWDELNDPKNEEHPLTNKAVSGQYPPGSTFKMVTAMAGLEAGIINEHTTVHCPGHYNFGSMLFHCWKKEGHGTMNVVSALQQSCDTFFYEIGNRTGIDRIAAMARKLGLGERLGIELAEEQPGLMPDPEWKKRVRKEKWHPGETINASIGQGTVLTTPLQLATMTARLVNGGRAVLPWLVAYANEAQVHNGEYPDLKFNPENLKLVMRGMWDVVNTQGGTAYASRLKIPDMTMGGKTGTSQVRRITMAMRNAGVKNEDLPWKDRHHALFVGYAPAESPRYAIAVIVEHGVGGSKAAAPVARDILTLALQRDPARSRIQAEGGSL